MAGNVADSYLGSCIGVTPLTPVLDSIGNARSLLRGNYNKPTACANFLPIHCQ